MWGLISLLLILTGCSSGANSAAGGSVVPANEEEVAASFSQREQDAVRRQIEDHWIIDAGMPGLEQMHVAITVDMNPNGSVQSASFDRAEIKDDPNWKLFAESCRRAIFRASPLRMPPDKPYALWKKMTLVFSARDLAAP